MSISAGHPVMYKLNCSDNITVNVVIKLNYKASHTTIVHDHIYIKPRMYTVKEYFGKIGGCGLLLPSQHSFLCCVSIFIHLSMHRRIRYGVVVQILSEIAKS